MPCVETVAVVHLGTPTLILINKSRPVMTGFRSTEATSSTAAAAAAPAAAAGVVAAAAAAAKRVLITFIRPTFQDKRTNIRQE